MIPAGAVLVAVAVVAGASIEAGAGAAPGNSKVIDRTLSCEVVLIGGLYKINVDASLGVRTPGKPTKWKYLADAGVGAANGWGSASVEAGPTGSLAFTAAPVCKTARRFPLSSTGLVRRSPSVPPAYGDHGFACYPGSRFLARVRGVFAAPTSFHVRRYGPNVQLEAKGLDQGRVPRRPERVREAPCLRRGLPERQGEALRRSEL